MPNDPTYIQPPPPPRRAGVGCFGKGCLFLIAFAILTLLVVGLGSYLLFSGGSKPVALPIEELPPAQLSAVEERIDQF